MPPDLGAVKRDSSPTVDAGLVEPPEEQACGSAEESQVLAIVNQERAKQQVAPLACDLAVADVASFWIANTILFGLVVGEMAEQAAMLWHYRRGV